MLPYLLAVVIDESAFTVPAPAPPPHVYLHAPTDGCDSRAAPDEVVVCGNKDAEARFRLQPVDGAKYAEAPVRAQMKVGKGTLGINADQAGVGGFASNRVMVTLKLPF